MAERRQSDKRERECRDRARRRLLKLVAYSPPTILTLSALTGFRYGGAPSPSAGTGAKPDAIAHANPQ